MSPHQFWAVFIAAIGWLRVENLLIERAAIGPAGTVSRPSCYKTNPGAGLHSVRWVKGEIDPYPLWVTVILAILSLAALVIINFSWNWVTLIILIVLTLPILFAGWCTDLDRKAAYFVEDRRVSVDDDRVRVVYRRLWFVRPEIGDLLGQVIVGPGVLVLIFWGISHVVMDNAVRTGILLALVALLVILPYVLVKRQQGEESEFLDGTDRCGRCGGELTTEQTQQVIRDDQNESGGYIYYSERTEYGTIRRCKICGMVN